MSSGDTLPVGKVVGLHGVRGEVKLLPYDDEDLFTYRKLLPVRGGVPCRPLTVERARRHKGLYILKLRGIDSRDEAAELLGRELHVNRSEVPEPAEGEYFSSDLIGSEVFTEEGRALGKITKIFSTGSNDVFEVRGAHGEVLIPVIEDVIISIDLSHKRVTVRLLEGLLPEDER